jgi:GntR family transcriptional regulator
MIRDNKLSPGSKLPVETELANMLGVGRSTLREALHILEEEGVIVRRHGVGTFIREEVRLMRNPLEVNFGVSEIIESIGLRPGTSELQIVRDKADSSISEKLKIDKGSSIVILKRVRTADGKPIVYSTDILPETTLGKVNIPESFRGSLYKYLEKRYGQKVDYGVAKIIPTLANAEICRKLEVSPKSLFLLICQIDYNIKNQPIVYTEEYWRPDLIEFIIFRKRW